MIKSFKDVLACFIVMLMISIEIVMSYTFILELFATVNENIKLDEKSNIQKTNTVNFGAIKYTEIEENINQITNNEDKINVNSENIELNNYEENQVHNQKNEINLNEEQEIYQEIEEDIEPEIIKTASGEEYSILGTLKIDEIKLNLPILSKTTQELMRISGCRLWGPNPNEVGNLCIIGHNWRNTKLFSKVPNLDIGSVIEIIDLNEKVVQYRICEKYLVYPDNVECLNQETNGKRIVTLITCNNDSSQRYVFHAEEL